MKIRKCMICKQEFDESKFSAMCCPECVGKYKTERDEKRSASK